MDLFHHLFFNKISFKKNLSSWIKLLLCWQIMLINKSFSLNASAWRACAHDPGKSIKPKGNQYQMARSKAPRITSIEAYPVIPLLDQTFPLSQVKCVPLWSPFPYWHKKIWLYSRDINPKKIHRVDYIPIAYYLGQEYLRAESQGLKILEWDAEVFPQTCPEVYLHHLHDLSLHTFQRIIQLFEQN